MLPQGYPPQAGLYPPAAPQFQGAPHLQAPQFQGGVPQYGAAAPQGYAPHPAAFAPGPPLPGVDRNGVPMHGSVPGNFSTTVGTTLLVF